MDNNSIIKKDSAFVQKVGNQIAVTNKLLQNSFDYLKWWNELDENWKKSLILQVNLKSALIRTLNKTGEYTTSEMRILKFSENNRNDDIGIESVTYLLSLKEISLYYEYEICDFKSIKHFSELEEIKIGKQNEIKNLESLIFLKNLKKINIPEPKINKEEIEQFIKDHPNCEVIL